MFSMKTVGWLGLGLLLSSSLASVQNGKIPPFSGTWVLNMQRSKVEAAHPPVSGEAVILYDGKTCTSRALTKVQQIKWIHGPSFL